jgi:hypothetical protein
LVVRMARTRAGYRQAGAKFKDQSLSLNCGLPVLLRALTLALRNFNYVE